MSAVRDLITEAESRGVRVYLKDGVVKVLYRGAAPSDLLLRLRAEKADIEIELFSAAARSHPAALGLHGDGQGAARAPSQSVHTTNCCACGKIAIFGVGWFLRNPERARWYCAACFPRERE